MEEDDEEGEWEWGGRKGIIGSSRLHFKDRIVVGIGMTLSLWVIE